MGMLDVSEAKNGTKIILDRQPWLVLKSDFTKPGKGQSFYTLRSQNLLTKNVLEKNFKSGEKVESADVTDVEMEYLYSDANGFVFMDSTTFEQMTVQPKVVGDKKDFLLENTKVAVTLWNGEAIDVRLPGTMHFEIEYTEPAVKGDTQSRVMKPAKLKGTGATVQVPIFCSIGDKISVNTESREYSGRSNK